MRQPEEGRRGIRAQLRGIVLIPGATFLALFALLGAVAAGYAAALHHGARDAEEGAAVAEVLAALQTERRLAAEHLAAPGAERLSALRSAAETTDSAVSALDAAGGRLRSADDPGTAEAAASFHSALAGLGTLRSGVIAGELSATEAADSYGSAADRGIALSAAVPRTLHHAPSVAAGTDAAGVLRAQQGLAAADARLSGALAGSGPADDDRRAAVAAADAADQRLSEAGLTLPGGAAARSAAQTAATPAEWREAADPAAEGLTRLAAERAAEAAAGSDRAAHAVAAGAAAAIAASLLAGLFASRAASRRAAALIDRLARLRADTLALARSELPAIVARLERGDQVDPDGALPALDYGADEVGQVADAFTIAQRTAVRAAVRQADLRAGVSRVVLGIAHRDQSLVQRQLALLDRIEREEEDPDLLGDLFLLDHLATRGRRNAENLVILAGGRPGRRWHDPVPLVDVLRAAVSETEEYARVDVEEVPGLALSGAAVADIVHLLAELVDNATAFSPPHARVSIRTEPVPKGVVVEVEDRGLGMPEEALERANATLRAAPEFDVMALNRDLRLGLFVVARLAARHGAAVELCPSACGGTRAVVLLPAALTVAPAAEQGRSGPQTGPAAAMARPAAGSAAAASGPAAVPAPAGHPVRGIQAGSADAAAHGRRARRRPEPAPLAAPAAGPPHPDTAAGEAPAGGADPAPPDAVPEGAVRPVLPRRRKQAGLAPQLRAEPNRSGPAPAAPEDARRMMEAFQSGTRRGRRDELEHMGESSD